MRPIEREGGAIVDGGIRFGTDAPVDLACAGDAALLCLPHLVKPVCALLSRR